MKEKNMVVMGIGTVSKRPDYVEINMQLISANYDYNVTMDMAREKYNKLLKSLSPLGFKSEDLKTTNFTINAEYESVIDEKVGPTTKFIGYKAVQSLILGFYFNLAMLNNVINAINSSGSVPNIDISFTLKDKNIITNEVINKAVRDARIKADILAASAGVNLLNIININYAFNKIDLYSNTRYFMEYNKLLTTNIPLNIEPKDITVTDNVTITWEII